MTNRILIGAIGISAIFTALVVGVEYRTIGLAVAAQQIPAQDRSPSLTESLPPRQLTRMSTDVVLPDGRRYAIRFNRDVCPGDEIWFSEGQPGAYRILRSRYEVFDTYTGRLIYVEKL